MQPGKRIQFHGSLALWQLPAANSGQSDISKSVVGKLPESPLGKQEALPQLSLLSAAWNTEAKTRDQATILYCKGTF